jgi:hypothetical protein
MPPKESHRGHGASGGMFLVDWGSPGALGRELLDHVLRWAEGLRRHQSPQITAKSRPGRTRAGV